METMNARNSAPAMTGPRILLRVLAAAASLDAFSCAEEMLDFPCVVGLSEVVSRRAPSFHAAPLNLKVRTAPMAVSIVRLLRVKVMSAWSGLVGRDATGHGYLVFVEEDRGVVVFPARVAWADGHAVVDTIARDGFGRSYIAGNVIAVAILGGA
jgi:hypothetical protein